LADVEPMMRGQGLRFSPLAVDQAPAGSMTPLMDTLKEQSGFLGTLFAIRAAAKLLRLLLEHAPSALRREGVDAVLADQNEPAFASVAEHLGLPFASICTSLPINRETGIPPSFTPWEYGTGTLARVRNAVGYGINDFLIRELQNTLNEYRKRWGLAALHTPDDSFSTAAQIAQMPAEFDFPRRMAPGLMHYTGPWMDEKLEAPLAGAEFPFEKLDGRPILYASLGTLQSASNRHFEIIAKSCEGIDLQVVVSLGAREGAHRRKLPGNHLVVAFAPQIELLKRTALTITHAGMNTTMQALSFGIPLVAIPLAHDQPAIAARLKRVGAGIVLSAVEVSVNRLRTAINSIREKDSPWQQRAKFMQEAIAKAGGVVRAVNIIEQSLF
jgi:MGT family glycosyltransferase